MKKIINYILGIAFLTGFSSCGTDWLDVPPETSVATESALSTEAGLQTALDGAYRQLAAHWFYGDRIQIYNELKGEDMQNVSVSSRCYGYYSFTLTADAQDLYEVWELGYEIIHYVNNIIGVIDENFDTSNSNIAEIRSESLAIRALVLFQLTNIFGDAYAISPSSLGACIVTEDDEVDYKPARSTVAECYAQVVSDFKEAIGGGLPTTSTNGYMNKWAAEALLSRVYLYMGDYSNALSYAKDVINNASSLYSLYTNAEYSSVWGKDFQSESIFELYYDAAENVGADCMQTIYNWTGYAGMILTQDYLDLLDEDADDVRHCFTSVGDGTYTTTTRPVWLTKFCGSGTVDAPSNVQYNNFYVIRLSELYLTAAECEYRTSGASSTALGYINKIVTRANPGKVLTASDLTSVNRILEERRRELVGEGVSGLYDILRTRGASGIIDHSTGWHIATLNYKTISCSNDLVTAPVPNREITNNSNVKQNDGY